MLEGGGGERFYLVRRLRTSIKKDYLHALYFNMFLQIGKDVMTSNHHLPRRKLGIKLPPHARDFIKLLVTFKRRPLKHLKKNCSQLSLHWITTKFLDTCCSAFTLSSSSSSSFFPTFVILRHAPTDWKRAKKKSAVPQAHARCCWRGACCLLLKEVKMRSFPKTRI